MAVGWSLKHLRVFLTISGMVLVHSCHISTIKTGNAVVRGAGRLIAGQFAAYQMKLLRRKSLEGLTVTMLFEKNVLERPARALLRAIVLTGGVLFWPGVQTPAALAQSTQMNKIESANGTGVARTITTYREFDQKNPFFKALGTNGRSCATCHVLSEGLTMNPEYADTLFELTQGLDPLFAAVDGTNSPRADMSSLEARRNNTSLLRRKGLFRVELTPPANAEFSIERVDDPYGYAGPTRISLYRRPLPSTNVRFLSAVMWDGRESIVAGSVAQGLRSQVNDAVLGHMQAVVSPSENDISAIVDFESHLYTSQIFDKVVGSLDTKDVKGAPERLISVPFFPGINKLLGPRGISALFNPNIFTVFRAGGSERRRGGSQPSANHEAVIRGQRIFNFKPFTISGVAGFSQDMPPFAGPREGGPRRGPNSRIFIKDASTVRGTCGSCHNTHEVGSNSLPLFMNTGTADGALRTPDLPLYTLRNRVTGEVLTTTDPGVAMTTGKWQDIGKFKVPSLRALETHSPYFHHGFSGELLDLIEFYNTRFHIGLTQQEKEDLKAFLVTL